MAELRTFASTSNILRVVLRKADTGMGLTALTSASSGLIISTVCDNETSATTYTSGGSTIEAVTTIGTYAAPTATKCRFKLVDNTNQPGLYELQLADARFAVANAKTLTITLSGVTNLLDTTYLITLTRLDHFTAPMSAGDVLDTPLSGHTDPGTVGEAIDNAGSGADAGAIADAVWDEPNAGHVTGGTMGHRMAAIGRVFV